MIEIISNSLVMPLNANQCPNKNLFISRGDTAIIKTRARSNP